MSFAGHVLDVARTVPLLIERFCLLLPMHIRRFNPQKDAFSTAIAGNRIVTDELALPAACINNTA